MIERCENLFIPWQCHSHKWSDWGTGNRPCRDKIRLDRDNRPELSEVEFRTRRPESLHNHPIPSICKKLFFLIYIYLHHASNILFMIVWKRHLLDVNGMHIMFHIFKLHASAERLLSVIKICRVSERKKLSTQK